MVPLEFFNRFAGVQIVGTGRLDLAVAEIIQLALNCQDARGFWIAFLLAAFLIFLSRRSAARRIATQRFIW